MIIAQGVLVLNEQTVRVALQEYFDRRTMSHARFKIGDIDYVLEDNVYEVEIKGSKAVKS